METQIWIIDFGSQYTQLIAKRTRQLGFSSTILTFDQYRRYRQKQHLPKALIISGGPHSTFDESEDCSPLFDHSLPLLGICYGMQLIGQHFQGSVTRGTRGEYGKVHLTGVGLPSIPCSLDVWMSHRDHLERLPPHFNTLFTSKGDIPAAIKHEVLPILGLQFHPEVEHTSFGREILLYFLRDMARLTPDWNPHTILESVEETIRPMTVEDTTVLCALSGGVDSLVAAEVTRRIIGKRLHCFFVDNGLLRPQDEEHIETLMKDGQLNIQIIDAKKHFLQKLRGASDPEEKRKRIGHAFIEVFEQKVHQFEKQHRIRFSHLLQGTLYPDVIESVSPHKIGGKSVTIKSHHNVGGLPEKMQLKLLEPLRFLFKDEVRALGKELGLPTAWCQRHPFPGPGIGVRILGEITPEAIRQVRQSDQILQEELTRQNYYHRVSQALTVLLPVKTVGIKGDRRCYEKVVCLRLVSTDDFMTASCAELPLDFLTGVSRRITNEVMGITRVVHDLTSKPPGTIEWE